MSPLVTYSVMHRRKMSCPTVSLRITRWLMIAGLFPGLLGGSPQRGFAQIVGPAKTTIQWGTNVTVQPATLALSDTNPTGTFTIASAADDTTYFWLAPACTMPYDSTEHGSPIAAAWHNETPCAIPWLSDFPQYVQLPPHERRTISLRMIPPSTLPDGRYTARLIWANHQPPAPNGLEDGWTHDEVDIIYTKGPTSPRPSRLRWRATLPASRVSRRPQVHATPAVLVFDNRSRTATITLRNPAATPTEVWLAVECPWFRVNYQRYPVSHQYESAWHGRIPNASLGVTGYPQHLVLAPHERRTISITMFDLAASLPEGSYYAQLLYVQSPVLSVSHSGDTTFTTPGGAVTLVFHKGATPPHLTLRDLHVTPSPRENQPSQACVTVAQSGLGLVTLLHAELDDRHHTPVWRQDTTVAVWEVVHHHPMEQNADVVQKAPDPICLALPALATGHYQLQVAAYELEDTAKHSPVRATIAVDVP